MGRFKNIAMENENMQVMRENIIRIFQKLFEEERLGNAAQDIHRCLQGHSWEELFKLPGNELAKVLEEQKEFICACEELDFDEGQIEALIIELRA